MHKQLEAGKKKLSTVRSHFLSVVAARRDGTAQLQSELQSLTQQEAALRKQLEAKEKRLQDVESNIQDLQQKIQDMRTELASELHNHLSATERQELADLTPRLKQLQVCAFCLCTGPWLIEAKQGFVSYCVVSV